MNDPTNSDMHQTAKITSGSGNLVFKGHVSLIGSFSGTITASGDISLESNAYMNGSIHANNFYLMGKFSGNAFVSKKAVLYANSSFSGYLKALDAEFRDGCTYRGEKVTNEPMPKQHVTRTHPIQEEKKEEESSFSLKKLLDISDE